uniref:beta strand repeat-containing protein n=1 Tax=Sulfurimonas sp. TaxID=2022749 RepID=UPI003D131D1B
MNVAVGKVQSIEGKFFAKIGSDVIELKVGDSIVEGMIVFGDKNNPPSARIEVVTEQNGFIVIEQGQSQLFDSSLIATFEDEGGIAPKSVVSLLDRDLYSDKTEQTNKEDDSVLIEKTEAGEQAPQTKDGREADFDARDGDILNVTTDIRDTTFPTPLPSEVDEDAIILEEQETPVTPEPLIIPAISIASVSATEGDYEVFTVALSTAANQDISFDLTTTIGTATTTDYDATNMEVSTDGGTSWQSATSATIVAGDTDALVRVPTVEDTIYEGDETFSLIATVTDGTTLNSSATGVATIIDNDSAPTISINDVTVNEDSGTMTFTVTLSNPSASTVIVDYASSPTAGTATAGADYTAVSGTLTFDPSVTTQTITVPITDDFIAEGSETFDMVLSNAVNATISDDTGLGIITDESTPGAEDTISVTLSGDAIVTEGSTATYTVSLSQNALTDMDIDVVTGHTTTEDGDLVPTTMTVTIPAGSNSVSFTITNNDDAYAEGDEDYTVTLSGVTTGGGFENVSVDTTPFTTTIQDNTTPGTEADDEVINVVLSGDSVVDEGGSATYTITLDQPTTTAMQVEVQTGHITTDDGDLVASTFMVEIPAGATSATFTVDNAQDTIKEGDEDYSVTLTGNSTGGGFETVNISTTPLTTTISDDETLSIRIDDVTVNEDAGTMTFTVSLSVASASDVTFDYASADGSATAGADYTAVSGSGVIVAGSTTTTITVPITDDYITEGSETFEMNLTNVSSGVVIADAQGIGTIVDESTFGTEDTVTVSISGTATVAEGEDASYVVTTDKAVATDLSVDVTYSYISAQTGDIVEGVSTITIPAGSSSSAPFSVAAVDDAYLEGDEVFNVTISNPQGGGVENVVLGTDTQSTTIQDGADEPDGGTGSDDTATISISGDADVIEGESASYTVSLDKVPTSDVDVDVTYTFISAQSGDIITTTTTVTIPANSQTMTFDVATIDDVYAEGDEIFSVVISNPTGGGFENLVVGTSSVQTTIYDDATPGTEPDTDIVNVTLSGDSTVNEGGSATYTITLDAPAATDMDVEVQTGHITTDNGDLVPVTTTVTIPAGSSSTTFTVDNVQDTITEGNEDYSVTLTGTTTGGGFENVSVDTTPLTTTIVDDEGVPSLSINDVSVDEDAGTMTFTVTLSNTSTENVTFDYASIDGSATAGADYTAVSGSGIITAGSTTTTITVPITDDYITEGSENFTITLSNQSSNALIADGTGIGTITDEATPSAEDTVTLTLSGDATVEESTQASYTVTADKPVATDLSVDIVTVHVDTETGDFVEVNTTVTIPAGSTSVTFNVDTNDDAYAEGSETYNVVMSNPIGGGVENVVLGTSTVSTAIVDETSPASEDTATVSISGDISVVEGDTATYTLTVDRVPTEDLNIDVTTGHISTEDGDYIPVVETITIPAGSTTVTFTVDTVDDAIKEPTEDYSVTITDVNGGGFENSVIGVSSITTSITNNDTITVESVTSDTQTEGTTGNDLVHTVTMSGESTTAETYSFSLTDTTTQAADHGTPTFSDGVTYDAGTGLITVPAGVTSFTITTSVTDDALADSGEYYTLDVGGVSATGTILDETNPYDPSDSDQPNELDAGATVSISGDETVWEGNTATYTVSTDIVSTSDILVTVVTGHVTTDDGDLVPVSTTVTIPAGDTSATFTVDTTDDALADSGETYTASITGATSAEFEAVAIGTSSVTTTIVDASDPTPPITPPGTPDSADVGTEISISGATSTLEGVGVEYTVSVTNAPVVDMDVEITVSNITTDGDVVVSTQTVTILAGETEAKFTIDNVDDAIKETPEDYQVEITDYTTGGYEAVSEGTMTVTTTINDNESVTVVSVTSDTEVEGGTLVHDVTMSGASTTAETYSFSLTDTTTQAADHGTPTFSDGVTYDSGTGLITVPAGVISFTITTSVMDDTLADSGEYYTLSVGGQSATGTILDDSNPGITEPDAESALVSISGAQTIVEGETSTAYTVSVDQPASDVTSAITVE